MMRLILLYLFILFACSVSAEPLKITGKVVDPTNEPCIGAAVLVGGTHRGTSTDVDGNFSIEVEKGEILKFSCIGYYEKAVEVLSDSSLVIDMKEWIEFCYCAPFGLHLVIPENQLKSSLQTIQILYPDLNKCKEKGNLITYVSESRHAKFSIYNGIVCKQYYSFEYKPTKYLGSVYHDFAGVFKGYDSCVESKSRKEITFYYHDYSVHIKHFPKKRVSLTYELYPEYYK